MPPTISFLSDYGHDDDFVGVCHGVIARIAPEARVIDVTHGIPRHDVRAGALVLRRALPFMPAGRAPGGRRPGGRRASAARSRCAARRRTASWSGPDNGLLCLAAERFGGVVEAVDIGRSPLAPASRSRRRSTAATSSPRWRRSSRPGPRWPRPASRSTPTRWSRLELPRPQAADGDADRARARGRPLRQRHRSTPTHEELAASGSSSAARVELEVGPQRSPPVRASRSPTCGPASCSSTRTPTARWRWR